ncbi:hypothetical protein KSC_007760 [Ktedonobacter sp. SOSP1-52]|uniref:YdeI/OmpD-associated family protein n=1 Tax=Ktedonobacter sp. SOSP1-52 TaxID=2778366 RepID=UPI0019150592|nr:YdeI/OmpD-associated family protein [Ktedonobacter sp. SOSP1-52]GHO61884.1 hypothetical protein KSC_007760 [Ktedonobacter sp. SOSP1-52]
MASTENLPTIGFTTQQDWESWLHEKHDEAKGLWLKLAKKESGIPSISYAEALDVALCYGWIDGQKASLDEQYWLQKFTPRGARSMWSQVNREKAMVLIAEGRMQPAGQKQIERAKADGRWEHAYESQSKIGIPDDFQSELDQHPLAKEFFATLNSRNRYAILYSIQTAKKAETRSARIQKFIEMLSRQEKIYS